MKTVIFSFVVLFVFTLLQSCYKDKGNYDLVDYNAVASITVPTPGTVVMGDTFKIDPVITWKYPKRDTLAFTYQWKQNDSVISNQRSLKYVPDTAGYIWLYLYMTENATGIVTRLTQQIKVVSGYKAGWLFLLSKNGASELSLIRRDAKRDAGNNLYYEYKYFPEIYKNNYPGESLGKNPAKLYTRAFPAYTSDEVLLFQDNQAIFLDGNSFKRKISLQKEFPGSTFPQNATPVDYVDGGPTNFALMNDGNVYWKRNSDVMGGLHGGLFMDVPVYFEGGGAQISYFPETSIDQSEFIYAYDRLHKRFLGFFTNSSDDGRLGSKLYINSAPPAGFVPLTDQTGYTLMYCSDYSNGSSYMNILKDESTGQYLYQTYDISMNIPNLNASNERQELFAGNGIVSNQTVYYRIRNSSYLFFGEGSKLYFYDINTKTVKLYHDLAAGRITHITTDANSGELGVMTDNGTFVICSLKNAILGETDPGASGILFTQSNMGNVVDLQWKWGSYYEYYFRRYP